MNLGTRQESGLEVHRTQPAGKYGQPSLLRFREAGNVFGGSPLCASRGTFRRIAARLVCAPGQALASCCDPRTWARNVR